MFKSLDFLRQTNNMRSTQVNLGASSWLQLAVIGTMSGWANLGVQGAI